MITRGRYMYNESNYPVQELGRKRGGGRISGTLRYIRHACAGGTFNICIYM